MLKLVKILIPILLLAMLLAIPAFAEEKGEMTNPFKDVLESDYWYEGVMWACENNITKGTSQDKFSPNSSNTRGQMVTFLYRAAGSPIPKPVDVSFDDVEEGAYYYDAVRWAVGEGITKGLTSTKFGPNEKVSRGQTVTFLFRFANAVLGEGSANKFKDVSDGDYFYDAVLWAVERGITLGTDSTHFSPNKPCTRGQIVTFLYRLMSDNTLYPVQKLEIDGVDISEFVICCPEPSTQLMKNAASQLQRYINLTCGAQVEIINTQPEEGVKRILLLADEKYNKDNFRYYNDEDGFTIEGNKDRSIIYGVFDFLEDYVGWNYYASDTETCDLAQRINVTGVDKTFERSFEIRDIYVTDYFDTMISVKRMLNGDGKRRFGSEWGGLDGFTGSGCHTFDALSGHPENGGNSANPCLNDPEIVETMLANVKKLLAENPNARMISVSQNDTQQRCHCSKCQADDNYYQSPAGSIIKLCNYIAREVKEEYPNVLIVTFAYQYSRPCPVNIVCEDNVMVEICSTDICYNHPFSDPDCEKNKAFAEDFMNWSKICKQLYVWDYTIFFKYYLCPFPNFDVLRENIKFFRDYNVMGVFEQGHAQGMPNPEFGVMRSYLISLLFENPDMSEEEYYYHMDCFLKAFYGEGWRNIRAYIDWLTEKSGNMGEWDWEGGSSPETIYGSHAFAPISDQLVKWFDEAEELAKDEVQLKHVQLTRLSCDWMRLGAIFLDMYQGGTESRQEIFALNEQLFLKLKSFNQRLGENVPLPDSVAYKINVRRWASIYGYKETD